MGAAVELCAAELRRGDYDRYLSCLFAPPPARGRLLALHALDRELARAAAAASEPRLGEIRLQWWFEAIADAYRGRPPAHPAAQAFAETGAADRLPRPRVESLVEARRRELDDSPFADRAELTAHLDSACGAVVALALAALGAAPGAVPERGALAAGRAWGLARLACAPPARPRPVLRSGGARELAAWAGEHLAELPRRAPRSALPALLPASLARLRLARRARGAGGPPPPAARQWFAVVRWLRARP